MSDKPNANPTKKPAMVAEAAKQSPPIDTASAQLVYDDLRRFCEARRSDIASIITRSQFLLVLTSSLYAAYFIARPSPMAFSLLEAIAALVMLPSVAMLLQSSRPLGYHDNLIDLDRIRGQTEIQEFIIILIADLADRLLKVNERHGQRLRRSYYAWLASLLVAAFVLLWEHI